jgi:hypothetical protein
MTVNGNVALLTRKVKRNPGGSVSFLGLRPVTIAEYQILDSMRAGRVSVS